MFKVRVLDCTAVVALLVTMGLLAPSFASAASGTVTAVRSCYASSTTRHIVFQIDNNKWYFGTDSAAGTGSIASIATAALLAGRTVKFVNGTGAVWVCGSSSDSEAKLAFPIHTNAAHFIELQ